MRVLVVGHDHVASAGALGAAWTSLNATVETWRLTDRPTDTAAAIPTRPLPAVTHDHVVVLGAPWADAAEARWARSEVEWLRDLAESGTPVLGICFGAHQLARALGGGTTGSAPRLGTVALGAGADSPPGRALEGRWFAWDSERLVPPPGARVVAASDDGCEAFAWGRCLGVGVHPEMTSELLAAWMDASPEAVTEPDRRRLAAEVTALESDPEWGARVAALAQACLGLAE